MEKEFLNYTEALALKELGFDEPCFGYYTGDKKHLLIRPNMGRRNEDLNDIVCTAPLYQQAFRWFREKYELFSEVIMHIPQEGDLDGCFTYLFLISSVNNYTKNTKVNRTYYKSHEEAELECLKKLIEITQNTNKK